MHKSRNLQPKGSFFVVLVGFPIAKLLTVFQSKSEVKRWNWVNFSHFETLNSTNVHLRRQCRQNDCHGITVLTQRNSWKSDIFGADSILKKKKIKRASNLVLTFCQKIKTFVLLLHDRGNLHYSLPDINAFVWRPLLGTQANSHVCFRWMP